MRNVNLNDRKDQLLLNHFRRKAVTDRILAVECEQLLPLPEKVAV